MNGIPLYDRLAEVSEDIYRAVSAQALPEALRTTLEALWVRLDDLVEQIPNALEDAARDAVMDVTEDD